MIDHIEIPGEFVYLGVQWHGGQDSMLYAVSSTGNLTTGGIRPQESDYDPKTGRTTWTPYTDEEWYMSLWSSLESEVSSCVDIAKKDRTGDLAEDADTLSDFLEFIHETISALEIEYGVPEEDRTVWE